MTMDGSPIIGKLPVDSLYMNGGWCYGGFKATPASGWLHAHTIARDAPHPLNAAFTLERFARRRMIDEKGAGPYAWAHVPLVSSTHAADPLPLVRRAQPDRVHLRRRRDRQAARQPMRPKRSGTRTSTSATIRGTARRVVAAQRRVPAMVQGAPRHAHARHPRQRAHRRGRCRSRT